MAPVKTKNAANGRKKFTIDLTQANAEGSIIKTNDFAKYLKEHIKVDGRAGDLQDKVTVTATENKITIVATSKFSGKYVKYLTKRFLKKNELRDWLRIVATSRHYYSVRFFNLDAGEDEDEEDEDEEDDE